MVAAGRVAQGNRSHFSASAQSGKEEEEEMFHHSVSCGRAAWVPLPSPVANRAVHSAGPAASYNRDQGFISVFFIHSLQALSDPSPAVVLLCLDGRGSREEKDGLCCGRSYLHGPEC